MEERKTAAIVLGIIALIVIFVTAILPRARYNGTHTVAFKKCRVDYEYSDMGVDADEERAAHNKLALCLCGAYTKHPDTATAGQILKIYKQFGTNYSDSTRLPFGNNLDSILQNRKTVFDTLVLVD